jgi:hypothetical protein
MPCCWRRRGGAAVVCTTCCCRAGPWATRRQTSCVSMPAATPARCQSDFLVDNTTDKEYDLWLRLTGRALQSESWYGLVYVWTSWATMTTSAERHLHLNVEWVGPHAHPQHHAARLQPGGGLQEAPHQVLPITDALERFSTAATSSITVCCQPTLHPDGAACLLGTDTLPSEPSNCMSTGLRSCQALCCRVSGSAPMSLPGFHVDAALKRGAACWSPVWVGGVCRAAPGAGFCSPSTMWCGMSTCSTLLPTTGTLDVAAAYSAVNNTGTI